MKTIIFLLLTLTVYPQSPFLILMGDENIVELPNHISDGGFDNAALFWTATGGWAFAGSKAVYDNSADASQLAQNDENMAVVMAINTDYNLSFDIYSGTADIWVLNSATAVAYIARTTYAPGHHSIDFTTGGSISTGGINFFTYINEAFEIDNIKLVLR